MFTSKKCIEIVSKNTAFKNWLPLCYFSEKGNEFVKNAKNLERVKANCNFSPSDFEKGKYILFVKTDFVCLKGGNKLLFTDFKDVENLKKYGEVRTTFLDILTDSNSEVYLFAADLHLQPDTDMKKIVVDGKFVNTYRTLFFLSEKEAQYVSHGRGLLSFCKSHKFCCYCGGSLKVNKGGFIKKCGNCQENHYPPISPVGITLIEDEKHEEVLLVRQQRHPPGMYSCIAGFIETGESLEENIIREVAEEVGVTISEVQYWVSRPWSLPNQLMLGCIATASSKDLDIDEKEVIDAKWVTAAELRGALKRVKEVKSVDELKEDKFWAPPSNTASHYLMFKWLSKYHS